MDILAIDPGNVTGISWWHGSGTPYVEEIPEGLYGFHRWWEEASGQGKCWRWKPDLILVEDFIIKADTYKKTREPAAYELVGAVKWAARTAGIPIDVFGSGEHTTFTQYKTKKKSKLVRLGWSVPSKDMHMDSASSLLLLGMKRHDRATADELLKEISTNV